jgi:8-oxo-dGTP diphosphatase
MASRPRARAAVEAAPRCAIDLVAIAPGERGLNVLLVESPGRRGGWQLPTAAWHDDPDLGVAAERLSAFVLGAPPTWHEQVGAFSDGTHPLGVPLSVAIVTAVARGTVAGGSAAWHPVLRLPPTVPSRQRAVVVAAMTHVRRCLDRAPVAFHLLPPHFTLTELQEVYELLLGRTLHKASFRRALLATDLVVATDEMRSEGRGRPAQLFTFDARRRRRAPRAIRFDFE